MRERLSGAPEPDFETVTEDFDFYVGEVDDLDQYQFATIEITDDAVTEAEEEQGMSAGATTGTRYRVLMSDADDGEAEHTDLAPTDALNVITTALRRFHETSTETVFTLRVEKNS